MLSGSNLLLIVAVGLPVWTPPQLLEARWPHDPDAATVPFAKRTATILQRRGLYANPALLNQVTAGDVLGWWNAGPVTVEDLRVTGNEAIRRHHSEAGLFKELEADLLDMASESWADHIWYRDPRFAQFVPRATTPSTT